MINLKSFLFRDEKYLQINLFFLFNLKKEGIEINGSYE